MKLLPEGQTQLALLLLHSLAKYVAAAESYSIEMKNYSFAHLACYEYQWNPFVILNAQVATQLVCIRRS